MNRLRLFVAVLALLPAVAKAQVLDYSQTVVVGTGRIGGMGGAFVGLGEGVAGQLVQPVAFTMRPWYAKAPHFEWDFDSGEVLNLRPIASSRPGSRLVGRRSTMGGFNIKLGAWGYGSQYDGKDADLEIHRPSRGVVHSLTQQVVSGIGLAQSRNRGAWHWGLAFIASTMSLHKTEALSFESDEELVAITGGGLVAGWLWTPLGEPFRVGASLRPAMIAAEPTGAGDPQAFSTMPESMHVPAQFTIGGSYQLGELPFNTPILPVKQPDITAKGRRYLLLASDLVVTAATPDGLDTVSYIVGRPLASGETPSLSLRAGAESEIIGNRLVLRAGSYYEPCRREGCAGKWHGTMGADLRLGLWLDWRLGLTVDLAKDYNQTGFGIGLWH